MKFLLSFSICFIILSDSLSQEIEPINFDYFGVHINLPKTMKSQPLDYYSRYISRFENSRISVGIIAKSRLDEIFNGNKKNSSPKNKFDKRINPFVFDKSYKTYYFSKRKGIKKYYSAYLVIDINPLMYLVYEVKEKTSYLIGEAFKQINETIKETSFPAGVVDGVIIPEKMDQFNLDTSMITKDSFFPDVKWGNPQLRLGKDDELILVWSDAMAKHHILRMTKSGEIISQIDVGDGKIYDIEPHRDGITMLISYPKIEKKVLAEDWERHNHIYLEKIDWDGNLIFSTHLLGKDKIIRNGDQIFSYHGVGSTKLAWSGEYYAVHFPTMRNFGIMDVHQGDVYMILDKDGNSLENHEILDDYSDDWGVSHSFSQEIIFDGEKFTRFSLGDGYPRAIDIKRNYPEHKDSISTASHGTFSSFPGELGSNYVWDTHFGNASSRNGNTYFCYDSEVDLKGNKFEGGKCNDIFFVEVDSMCQVLKKHRISKSKKIEDRFVSHVFINDTLVLFKWQSFNPFTLDKAGSRNSGGISEQLVLYNLKIGKIIKKEKIMIQYKGVDSDTWVADQRHENFYPFISSSFKDTMSTPLIIDNDGRIWMLKFLLNQSGFELIEIFI